MLLLSVSQDVNSLDDSSDIAMNVADPSAGLACCLLVLRAPQHVPTGPSVVLCCVDQCCAVPTLCLVVYSCLCLGWGVPVRLLIVQLLVSWSGPEG